MKKKTKPSDLPTVLTGLDQLHEIICDLGKKVNKLENTLDEGQEAIFARLGDIRGRMKLKKEDEDDNEDEEDEEEEDERFDDADRIVIGAWCKKARKGFHQWSFISGFVSSQKTLHGFPFEFPVWTSDPDEAMHDEEQYFEPYQVLDKMKDFADSCDEDENWFYGLKQPNFRVPQLLKLTRDVNDSSRTGWKITPFNKKDKKRE